MKGVNVIKRNGRISNMSEIMQQAQSWLEDALDGDYLLVFEDAKKPRTKDQNALMWVWFTCIAKNWSEASGKRCTKEVVHYHYCKKFLGLTLPNGETVEGNTSTLTSKEMTEFLNNVQADAATEFGITLLSISDPMYALWARQYKY